MIFLIGTGHVFDLSSSLLRIFDEKNPDVVCVELDKQRFNAIMMKRNSPESYKEAQKNLPLVYKLLARFQDNMASEYGVSAGDEMLIAINYAQSHQIPLEFIDMNAQHLFIKMWKSMPFLEKLRLLLSGVGGLFVSKKRVEEELKSFQNDFDSYIEKIGKKFPTIKKTLIDKRDAYMVNRLLELNEKYQKITACIGDGHVPGISKLLEEKNIEFNTIRLNELRNKKDADSTSAQFSIDYKPV
ncbi:MAG: TraB/GumN family protein [Thermoplasmatales archaeon]|nr:MAG: TraB/GumN family protein [Thermoplasmatales archaeon]